MSVRYWYADLPKTWVTAILRYELCLNHAVCDVHLDTSNYVMWHIQTSMGAVRIL